MIAYVFAKFDEVRSGPRTLKTVRLKEPHPVKLHGENVLNR